MQVFLNLVNLRIIYSCVIGYSTVNYLAFMVFFISENHARFSCSYKMVFLHSKIPKYFTRVILNDYSWLMLIPFWFNMDSIHSANFPMNTPSDPIMPSFIFSLSKFGTFTYNVVNCLIISTSHSAFRLLLWLVNLPFNYVSSNSLFLGSKYQAFCFTL